MNTATKPHSSTIELMLDSVILQAAIQSQNISQEQAANYILCLPVMQVEREIDVLIGRLMKVADCDRDALSVAMSTLVRAPDSAQTREQCIRCIAGSMTGYRTEQSRAEAKQVQNRLDQPALDRKFQQLQAKTKEKALANYQKTC